MKSLLIVRKLNVQNVNAIAGVTYGFPAISNFLGFSHRLSRALEQKYSLKLGGCAVICHRHQVQAYRPTEWGDYTFALTRNPLTREAKTAPFVEEGRMQMQVSLLIECDFDADDIDLDGDSDEEDIRLFEEQVKSQIYCQRLAGGTIEHVEAVTFTQLSEDAEQLSRQTKRMMLKLLPGFFLVDRSDLLRNHYASLKSKNPQAQFIDAWLDFAALKYHAVIEDEQNNDLSDKGDNEPDNETKASWQAVGKPGSGWLVPIMTGFKAISALYQNQEVDKTRDESTPFRFVEAVYGVGEWRSPHRIDELGQIIWRYQIKDDYYLCQTINMKQQTEKSQ